MSLSDQTLMRLALQEGEKGVGLTAPNPNVGAIVVRDGTVLGKGFHTGAGKPHAEVEALADVNRNGYDPKGSDIYITLEPCSTTGRTPPCTKAILESGIRRVIWAADDPNPAHQGAARRLLVEKGIEVVTGILAEEAAHLHRAFFKVQRVGLPWIIIKTAMSLDGRITRPPGEGQWLTGPDSRAEVQVLRGEVDAILTSGKTARNDNPRLDYRGNRLEKKQPRRLVYSNRPYADLPKDHHLMSANEGGETRFLKGDLAEELRLLAQEGVQTILVEAGGALVGQLLDQGFVDEWMSFFAPLVCGGNVPAVAGDGTSNLENRLRLHQVTYRQFDSDICMRGLVRMAQH